MLNYKLEYVKKEGFHLEDEMEEFFIQIANTRQFISYRNKSYLIIEPQTKLLHIQYFLSRTQTKLSSDSELSWKVNGHEGSSYFYYF